MPDRAALVAALISNRRLCIGCLTVQSKLRLIELDAVIRSMEKALLLHRRTGWCEDCGTSGTTFTVGAH